MEKIVIIGSAGSGKSTFARQLVPILGIEVFHLDRYFWQPKWIEKTREIRQRIQLELVKKDQWIIEGTYLNTSDIRLKAADTIIFLDTPGLVCFWRVLNRNVKYRRRTRPDLPVGCPEKLGLNYVLKILGFPLVKRKKLYERLREFECEKKAFYAFRTKNEVDRFLEKIKQEQTQEEYVLENMYILDAVGVGRA